MRVRIPPAGLLGTTCLLLLVAPVLSSSIPGALSAEGAGSASGDTQSRQHPDPLRHLHPFIRSLQERTHATILLESGLRPVRSPALLPEGLPLEAGMLHLRGVLEAADWGRVYLGAPATPQVPEAKGLASIVRALRGQVQKALAIEDVRAGRLTLFLKDAPVPGDLPRVLHGRRLRPSPVELLYQRDEAPGGAVSLSGLGDLERQQLELQAGGKLQGLAYGRMMQLLQALPPRQREEFATRTVQAGLRLWDATPPDQRKEMMQQAFGALQQILPNAQEGAAPRRPAPPGLDVNHLPVLKRLVRDLARKEGALVVIDPGLFVTPAPVPPAPALDFPRSLEAMTAPLTGVAWRRVYLPEGERRRIEEGRPAPELIAAVQTLDRMEVGNLAVEDPARKQLTTLVSTSPVKNEESRSMVLWRLRAPELDGRPVYVVYSTTPAAQGATLPARFDHLLRRQMGLILRMDPDQMERAMHRLTESHLAAGPKEREHLTALPMMAAMMAAWFPRQAKEQP